MCIKAIDCKANTTGKTFRDTKMTSTDKAGSYAVPFSLQSPKKRLSITSSFQVVSLLMSPRGLHLGIIDFPVALLNFSPE